MKVLSIFLIMLCLLSCTKKEESTGCYIFDENGIKYEMFYTAAEKTPKGTILFRDKDTIYFEKMAFMNPEGSTTIIKNVLMPQPSYTYYLKPLSEK